jgi:hypothetical protein
MKACHEVPCAGNQWGYVEKCTTQLGMKLGRTTPLWCIKQWRYSFTNEVWGPVCAGGVK